MRTKRQIIFLFLVLTIAFAKAQNTNDWKNPQIIDINKEHTTATFSTYKNEADALQFKTTDSEIYGIGGDDSWGAKTHKKYIVDGNEAISFAFIISPIL